MNVEEAVRIRSAYKYYGSSRNKKIVLNQLDMTVERGSIYGLLGASGCGKTTLLSCIVGRKNLNKGDIWVLGGKPGTKGSGVPGPRIGYMPQDIAIVGEFTVKQAIYYFGRIFGMSETKLEERFQFLSNLLDLPNENSFVQSLSGGQQRRVSFAMSMVHDPELLILDEPTVGLDPVLREKIWSYLVEVTSTTPLAVIITTHYIEEAKQANKIGLMRNGILLAEHTPLQIMKMCETPSLEEAFLLLSQKQGEVDLDTPEVSGSKIEKPGVLRNDYPLPDGVMVDNHNIDEKHGLHYNYSKSDMSVNDLVSSTAKLSQYHQKRDGVQLENTTFTKGRLKALFSKNILQFTRQPSAVLFALLFPICQIASFFVAIGASPQGLSLAIVNDEVPEFWSTCKNTSLQTTFFKGSGFEAECEYNKISCRFLDEFDDTLAAKVPFSTKDLAVTALSKGQVHGLIYIANNFSESFSQRRTDGSNTEDDVLEASEIQIWLDGTNQQLTYELKRKLLNAYKKFSENLMSACNEPKTLGNIPIHFFDPIYGSADEDYTFFIAPGVIITVIFFLTTTITSTIIISDRLDGVWDRSLVAGISTVEILFTHVVVQTVVVIIQTAEIMLLANYVFKMPNHGDMTTACFLLLLVGLAGMCYGFLISILCTSHSMANYFSTGSFYPMLVLCGIFWPLESMPNTLHWFSLSLPFTVPTISLRNILSRGWQFTNYNVYNGFIMVIAWIIILSVVCLIGIRSKT